MKLVADSSKCCWWKIFWRNWYSFVPFEMYAALSFVGIVINGTTFCWGSRFIPRNTRRLLTVWSIWLQIRAKCFMKTWKYVCHIWHFWQMSVIICRKLYENKVNKWEDKAKRLKGADSQWLLLFHFLNNYIQLFLSFIYPYTFICMNGFLSYLNQFALV